MKLIINGESYEMSAPITVYEAAKAAGKSSRETLAALVNGVPTELTAPVEGDCEIKLLTFADNEGKLIFRHTASHILAQAVMRLFPDAQLDKGPSTENGFFYDIDCSTSFTPDVLERIEAEMNKIIKENLKLERFILPRGEAVAFMTERNQGYKVEKINSLPEDAVLSFYRQGEFVDMCTGPHLFSTGAVKAVKLIQSTGAYHDNDSSKKMLQRINGVAFPSKAELNEYLTAVEEAKSRDHNKIGRELGYFCTSEYIGQGLPCLMPKGAKLFQILNRYVQDKEEFEYGYVMTRTPLMAKSDLYKISGHWDHYLDGMFVLGDPQSDKEVFALRPMTCPFQYQVYLAEKHSYKDLPIRYGETSTLFRNEDSGEMHGLIRVRQFTISEGHLILRPDQLESEFRGCVKLLQEVMKDIGLIDNLTFRLSKWDPNDRQKYIGTPEMWDEAEGLMRTILNHIGLKYTEAVGEAAFYGPKLDVQMKNVHGKEDTLVTVQVDLMLARQFEMKYTDTDGKEKYPYIIHRTSLGCYERTIALLLEKYGGALPLWLSPEQIRLMPITDACADYANELKAKMHKVGLRATVDERNEKIGYKIRAAQLDKIPYMLVIGEKETADGTVSVRERGFGDKGAMTADDFIALAVRENAEKIIKQEK